MAPSIQTSTIEFSSGELTIPAYLAHPDEKMECPIIVVLQEVFGVNAHIRNVTERLAHAGYTAIAPHIYHRQAPNFEVGYSEADLAMGRQYKNGTNVDELLSDILGAITYVQTYFPNSADQVGCIGFCFGGHVAYLAATLTVIQATASFYGAGIGSFTPGGGEPTLNRTPDISGTLYAFFGLQDPLITQAEIEKIETALQTHQIDHRIFRYTDATHGFFCDRRDSYHPQAAEDAWQQTLQLFEYSL
ncbi:MAG: dienelactone hydrolase family protein [Leptolyngbyaceae cyanobacterium]